jgi:hypothetical protein
MINRIFESLARLVRTKKKYNYKVRGLIAFELSREHTSINPVELQKLIETEDEKFPWDGDGDGTEKIVPKITSAFVKNDWSIPKCEWQFTISHNGNELSNIQIPHYERRLRRIAHKIATDNPRGVSAVRSEIIAERSNLFHVPCPNK